MEPPFQPQNEKQRSHRVTLVVCAIGAFLFGLMAYALRVVAANPVTGVLRHIDDRMTYAAYFMWALTVLLGLGAAGFINPGTQAGLDRKLGHRRVVHHHHHHHHPGPSAPPQAQESIANDPDQVKRWTD